MTLHFQVEPVCVAFQSIDLHFPYHGARNELCLYPPKNPCRVAEPCQIESSRIRIVCERLAALKYYHDEKETTRACHPAFFVRFLAMTLHFQFLIGEFRSPFWNCVLGFRVARKTAVHHGASIRARLDVQLGVDQARSIAEDFDPQAEGLLRMRREADAVIRDAEREKMVPRDEADLDVFSLGVPHGI